MVSIYLLALLHSIFALEYKPNQITMCPKNIPGLEYYSDVSNSVSRIYDGIMSKIFYSDTDECTVDIEQGRVVGLYRENYRAFLGIPYAKPPVSHWRWRSPRPAGKFMNGILNAKDFGNFCPQLRNDSPSFVQKFILGARSQESENCLNLNIWTPRKNTLGEHSLLPVIVFIHGGAFSTGATSVPLYNPKQLIKNNENVIVVSINYRLGIFGFLASKDLMSEANEENKGFGNYGLEDQILALKWVKKNIEKFGGNPENVTLMGHSAGAISINYLLHMLASNHYSDTDKLFQRAILQSGTVDTWRKRHLNDTITEQSYQMLIDEFFCSNPDCLRDVSYENLTYFAEKNRWELIWGPVIDYKTILDFPDVLMEKGIYLKDVQLVFTSTKDDGSLFVPTKIESQQDLDEFVMENYKELGMDVLAQYQERDFMAVAANIIRDSLFRCPSIRIGTHFALTNNAYYYQFDHGIFATQILSRIFMGRDLGVFHGSELIYLFENNKNLMTPGEKELAQSLQSAWIQFATDGTFSVKASRFQKNLPFTLQPFFKCEYWNKNSFAFQFIDL